MYDLQLISGVLQYSVANKYVVKCYNVIITFYISPQGCKLKYNKCIRIMLSSSLPNAK